MTIEFACGNCGEKLSTSDDRAGWRAKCPDCGEPVTVPNVAASTASASPNLRTPAEDREAVTGNTVAEPAVSSNWDPVAGSSMADERACPMCGAKVTLIELACPACGEVLEAAAGLPTAWSEFHADFRYAGFWRRVVAAAIDGMVLLFLQIAIFVSFGFGLGVVEGIGVGVHKDIEQLFVILSQVCGFVGAWLYFALMESTGTQATVGKMAIGVIVTDMDGRRISFARATGRYFGKFLSYLICLIGYVLAAFTERKQALHDIISGCLVIRRAG